MSDLRQTMADLVASIPKLSPEDETRLERERLDRERASERRSYWNRIAELPIKREVIKALVDDVATVTTAMAAVRGWVEARNAKEGKPTLVLLGGAGCGKTVAAAWALMRAPAGHYAKMQPLTNLYRAGFGPDAAEFQAHIRSWLLIVDELTTERDVDLGRAALQEVVDERQTRDRGTILIANRTRAELRERYDARTIDRLREGAVVVDLADKSLRRGSW